MRRSLTFGLYRLEQKRKLEAALSAFCGWLGDRLGTRVNAAEAQDYATLAERVAGQQVDIAWLPPIVFLRTDEGRVTPVVAMGRPGREGGYQTALVVREDSRLSSVEDLRGASVAWVDEWSASGYVIPRLGLRLGGVDPSRLFGAEAFYGTHSAAVRAVVEREADVAGTYAETDRGGKVIAGPWSEMHGARVRALMTFGEIPPDVIVVTRQVPTDLCEELRVALEAAVSDRSMRSVVKGLFGADGFQAFEPGAYDGLRAVLSVEAAPPSEIQPRRR